jgi:hypothetical protein
MKDQHTYTDKASYADSDVRWLLSISREEQNVQVFCDGESRTYDIPEKIIDFKVEDEYCYLYVKNGLTYQFKFELDKFLVGDIYRTSTGEFMDTFAHHVFGEDV